MFYFSGAIGAPAPCSIIGSLDALGSTSTIIGAAGTISKPAANSGVLKFALVIEGSGTARYQKNTNAFADVIEGSGATFANADTIKCEGVAMTISTSITFDIVDAATGRTIKSVNITRS